MPPVAATARAQTAEMLLAPLSMALQTGTEGKYVYRGKEHAELNLRTRADLEYALPTTSVGSALYGGAFAVTPLEGTLNFVDYAAGIRLSKNLSGQEVAVQVGWIYHSFPNQNDHDDRPAGGEQWALANRPLYNRSHEFVLGLSTSVRNFSAEGYAYYDLNLEQWVFEADIGYIYELSSLLNGLAVEVRGYAGYVNAFAANGDQRAAGVAKWRNDYAYLGASADISYQLRRVPVTIGAGIRYSWNSDGNASWTTSAAGAPHNRLAGNRADNLWWGVWVRLTH